LGFRQIKKKQDQDSSNALMAMAPKGKEIELQKKNKL
jgi:hypothetical protein